MTSVLRTLLQIAVVLAVTYGALRVTCLRLWTLPSDDRVLTASVAPTLEAGDLLVLWRIGKRERGDLVRCPDPEAPGRFVVARVMGEAKDIVEHHGASVTVNGKPIGSEGACTPARVSVIDPDTGGRVELPCELEQVGGGAYARLRAERVASAAKLRTDIPVDHVYLVSDDRDFHDDSRDFGPLPAAACTERVVFRVWSARGWLDTERRLTAIR